MLRHALRYPYLQRAQPCNVLRRLDFNSPHIIGRRLRFPPSRNTEAAVAQAVGGTAVAVAQEAEGLAVEPEAVPVAALAVVRVVAPEAAPEAAPVEAPVAEKAGLGAARQEASAHTAIRLTIRRGRLFRNFLRRLRPISR